MEILFVPDLLSGVTIEASQAGLTAIYFGARGTDSPGPRVAEAERQLREYLSGARRAFDLPLDLRGTPFQLKVWRALLEIPFGETRSYRDIAVTVGRPKGFQAIGQANHRNPVPIVVPCHRVIAADGTIGGYGGGLESKRKLLSLERRIAQS